MRIKQKIQNMWEWIKRQWKKIIIIIFGGVVLATGIPEIKELFNVSEGLKLKSGIEDVIEFQDLGNGTISYLYNTRIEVPSNYYKGLQETIEKRTNNAQFFKNNNGGWIGKFFVGKPFYQDKKTKKWYKTLVATTTTESFENQMTLSFFDKVLLKSVNAQVISTTTMNVGDGYVVEGYTISWNSTHDATIGDTADYTSDIGIQVKVGESGSAVNEYQIGRIFLPFDTSALGSGNVILSGQVVVFTSSCTLGDDDTLDYLAIVQADQPDPSSLTTSDFNNCGATDNPTEGSDRQDISTFITETLCNGDNMVFTLDSDGMSWVSTTGWTYFGMREGHDMQDSAIADNSNNTVLFSSYEKGTNIPYLILEYYTTYQVVNDNTNLAFCYQDTTNCYNTFGGNVRIGYRTSYGNCHTAARFSSLNIPQGATIVNATIEFPFYGSESYTTNVTSYAEDVDNSAVISTTYANADSPANKTLTTANTDWTIPLISSIGYYSFDVATSVQEVVNREGWVANNALTILIKNNGDTDNHNIYNYYTANGTTTLYITYTTATMEATSSEEINTSQVIGKK